jgi:hypothetical protein
MVQCATYEATCLRIWLVLECECNMSAHHLGVADRGTGIGSGPFSMAARASNVCVTQASTPRSRMVHAARAPTQPVGAPSVQQPRCISHVPRSSHTTPFLEPTCALQGAHCYQHIQPVQNTPKARLCVELQQLCDLCCCQTWLPCSTYRGFLAILASACFSV